MKSYSCENNMNMNIRKVARNAGARGKRGSIPLALEEQEAGGKKHPSYDVS